MLVFPWVVGISGMIDLLHVESILKFLDIQRKHGRVLAELIALASVRAFHFLQMVRFGGPLEPVRPDLDPDKRSSTNDESQVEDSLLPESHQLKRTAEPLPFARRPLSSSVEQPRLPTTLTPIPDGSQLQRTVSRPREGGHVEVVPNQVPIRGAL